MRHKQCYPWAEIPMLELEPLNFKPLSSDSDVVIYRALINSTGPGKPTFSVTVTAASPGEDQQAEAELESLLGNMRARFLLADRGPDEGLYDDREPESFNRYREILIEPRLAEPAEIKGAFGVIMVLQTAVEGAALVASVQQELARICSRVRQIRALTAYPPPSVPKGRDHKYTASSRMWATVTPSQGKGSIRWPRRRVSAGGTARIYAKRVLVHGRTYMEYTISAGWTDRGIV